MPDNTLDLVSPVLPGDTDPALTAIKLPVVKEDKQEPAIETHPDVWDEQGRLISHPLNDVV